MNRNSIEKLEFKDLHFSYEDDDALFEGVNFNFPLGENFRIKIAAGSGASSLLQILAGLKAGTGAYEINGTNVFEMSFEEFLPYRLNIGFSFDYQGLLANKTIRENLLMPLQYHRYMVGREGHEWVQFLMDYMGIKNYAEKRPAMVTGGVRKVACVLRSLVMQPQLILFDDPTTGMNADQKTLFIELVKTQQRKGHLQHCFFSSQDVGFLSNFEHEEIKVTRKSISAGDDMSKAVNL